MPLSIQIPYRGSDYLFQGIAGAGQSLGAGAEQAIAQYKQLQDAGKASDSFYRALGESAPSVTGIPKEQWTTLGARDKASAMVGIIKAQGAREMMNQLAQQTAALKQQEEQSRAEDALSQALSRTRGQALASTLAQGGGPVEPPPVDSQQLLNTVLSTPGAVNTRTGSALLLKALEQQNMEPPFFQPNQSNFNLPGVQGFIRVPTGPKTSVILAQPGSEANALPIVGPNGENLGFGLANRGGVTPLPQTGLTAKDQFNQLFALKREYVRARAQAFSKEEKAKWDQEIEGIDAGLKALQTSAPQTSGPSAPPGAPSGAVEPFATEAAARAAGKKKGDVIYLSGVGTVRLE